MTVEGLGGRMRGLSTGAQTLRRSALVIPRYVYFSFHYGRDIRRVQQIKNHWVSKRNFQAAGYFDGSLEEKANKESERAVKAAINKGMVGSSVTCVLIGAETSTRVWVVYEIFRSIERGMGIFGVTIHNLKDPVHGVDTPGYSPFDNLAYVPHDRSTKVWPYARYPGEWRLFALADAVDPSMSRYLIPGMTNHLAHKFRNYDWVYDDGYNNFPTWTDAAAKEAGR